METGRPRKHRSLLAEFLNKLDAEEKPVKTGDNVNHSVPVDEDKKKQNAEAKLKK